MIVLGIETSCDETSAALVDGNGTILGHVIVSKLEEHKYFGGVVPEISARNHLQYLHAVVEQTLDQANLKLTDCDAIAATCGPGLIGGLIVGATMGKAMAAFLHKPFLAINHLEAHVLTARMTQDIPFPYLVLLVSGGHCQLMVVQGIGKYKVLGTTLDDAVGEAFDKTAKMMGMDYPGGVQIEKWARQGDAKRFQLPKPLCNQPGCNFSFSGLKTAVRTHLDKLGPLADQDKADMAASLQKTIGDILENRCRNALELAPEVQHLVVGGGVSANQYIRQRLTDLAKDHGVAFCAPPMELCTDNGAMIAWAGIERLRLGMVDSLEVLPRPRWPLG